MNYNYFKSAVMDRLRLAADKDADIKICSVRKNNGVMLDAVTIMKKGDDLAPTIYLERYYDMYSRGADLDQIVRSIMRENCERKTAKLPSAKDLADFAFVRPRLGIRLINAEMNREILSELPHFPVLDLAAVCYIRLVFSENDTATTLVKNERLDMWNIGREELFAEAAAASIKNEPPKIELLHSVLARNEAFWDEEEIKESTDFPLYVLTNKSGAFGAVCLLYPHILEKMADALASDLVVIPSSIHEVLLTPDTGDTPGEEYDELVREVNQNNLEPFEVLSNHVYYYRRTTGKLVM